MERDDKIFTAAVFLIAAVLETLVYVHVSNL
jgi:hypothetical protein